MSNNKLIFLLVFLAMPVFVSAEGLMFSETMKGYGMHEGIYDSMRLDIDVNIDNIDEWRSNPAHRAYIEGSMTFGDSKVPVIGLMNILEESYYPCKGSNPCYHLVYRLIILSSDFPSYYVGFKTVENDSGFDVVDDMTTLQGCFSNKFFDQLSNYTSPECRGELVFEWWDFSTLWNFTWSFKTIDTPWYRDLIVKGKFLEIVFGNLARTYFPWMF